MKDERLVVLLDAYLDGGLSTDEKQELERMLLESDAARRQFWQRASLHGWSYAAAKMNYGARPLPAFAAKNPETPYHAWMRRLTSWVGWLRQYPKLAGVAAACVLALAAWIFWPGNADTFSDNDDLAIELEPEQARTNVVATLTRGAGVVWEAGADKDLEIGARLDPGTLRLKSGVVQIETASGVRMILEGPAELELVTKQEARLQYGKLSARVPEPAHGFKIQATDVTVTDLGTEFGVNRPPDRPAEVYVFEGKVELAVADTNHPTQLLTRGQNVEVQKEGTRPLLTNSVQFVTVEEVKRREKAELQDRYAAWKQAENGLEKDRASLAYFNFEKGRGVYHRLVNRASHRSAVGNGTIVGSDWTAGRWPGKGALEFARTNDRVQLTVPGHYRSLTYLAWVRVDGLENPYNGLAMSDGHKPGEIHWQMTQRGQVVFAVRLPQPEIIDGHTNGWDVIKTKSIFTKEWFGRWVQFAAVYDGPHKTMFLYLDGEVVATKKIQNPQELSVDAVEIGNWAHKQTAPGFVRNFSGRMDEFAVLSRPMSAQEIRRLYQSGKPHETVMLASSQPSPAPGAKP